jgi:O-methyltransferase involved in polyketide biosynthesis
VHWFEVDRSPHIAHKGAAISQQDAWVDRVHADIAATGWDEQLRASGLDPRQRTVWIAEGLVHYLPEGTLDRLLWTIRGTTPDAEFILTTIHPDTAARARGTLVRILRWLQEVPRVFFDAPALAAAAARAGWDPPQVWDYPAQVDAFVPQARSRPASVAQDVVRYLHTVHRG